MEKSNELVDQAGELFNKKGRKKEAIDLFKEAVREDPGSLAAHRNLGYALAQTGRHKEAINRIK